MKYIYSLLIITILICFPSISAHAETNQLPFIESGYTDEGVYYLYRQKNYTDIFQKSSSCRYFLKKCRYSF